jgi:hypothetical protein
MRRTLGVLAACMALGAAFPARGTTVLKLPIEEMTRRADLVIRAEVTDVAVLTVPGDSRPVSTDVTLRIVVVLKGQATAPTLRINLPGGVGKDASVTIPGMPTFHPGEEVVLFLERTSRGWIPSGLSQGKYRIRHQETGIVRAERAVTNLARVVQDPTSGQFTHVEGPDPEDAMDLPDLLNAVNRGLPRKEGAR